MDNLKLGYGGTKGEMERLLADAQKLTGVEYDINNLADVYSAIHVIQENLDITGTTAKEAASTISGSAKAMKSAFQNVLGKLTLGQDIQPALNGLAETTTTFLVGNLMPAVWNIIKALPGALVTFVKTAAPQMAQEFMSFVPELQTGLVTALPQLAAFAQQVAAGFCTGLPAAFPRLVSAGMQLLGQLAQGIVTALPQIAAAAVTMIGAFVRAVIASLPQILHTGAQMLTNLIGGITQSLPQLLTTAASVVLELVQGLVANFPDILAAGFDMIVSLIGGISDAFPDILDAALELVGMVWDTIKNTDWLELGKDIIRGLIDGLLSMGSALWEAAKNVANSVKDSIKEHLKIGSPSRVMRDEVGRWIPAGLALGITGNMDGVRKAMRTLAGVTTNGLPQRLTMAMRPARAAVPAMAGGYGQHVTNLYQTINTHDSLTPSEMTREAEDLLERQKWGLP